MTINISKSSIYFSNIEAETWNNMVDLLAFPTFQLEDGLKYLGLTLKKNKYGISNWKWLLSKVEKSVTFWCNRWISQGGRLVLIKLVIEAIPIY
jgi:hypothetical protein